MTEVMVSLPDALASRLERLADPTGQEVGDVLGQVIASSVPTIPSGVPDELRAELEELETLSDEALHRVAVSFLTLEEQQASRGQSSEAHMIRKAYANLILKWRGLPVSESDLKAACHT
ncbi:MAG: hypothetical protein AAF226_01420 [Verrucomicrobiota bacterium]